jgi:hypothetical protein
MTIQEKLKETDSSLQLRLAQEAQEAQSQRAETEFDIAGLKDRLEAMDQGLNEVNEKVHEFEQNKRNNLIFYGLNNEARETPEVLISKVQAILRSTLGIRREIVLSRVGRRPPSLPHRSGGSTPGPRSPAPAPSSSPSRRSRTARRWKPGPPPAARC